MVKILIIDDDEVLRQSLALYLEFEYYFACQAGSGREGLIAYRENKPNIVLLDLALPDMDGQMVLKEIRKTDETIPVIIITANDSDKNQALTLNLTADDYLVKPFDFDVLHARLRNAMSHIRIKPDDAVFECRGLAVDYGNKIVRKNDRIVELTSLQYEILVLLTKYCGRILEHKFILDKVWKIKGGDIESLRVEIQRLRQKIEDDPANPVFITSKYGIGYRFNIPM